MDQLKKRKYSFQNTSCKETYHYYDSYLQEINILKNEITALKNKIKEQDALIYQVDILKHNHSQSYIS